MSLQMDRRDYAGVSVMIDQYGNETKAPTAAPEGGAHIIVFGNEKGGSGKSTTAMHVAIALIRLGYNVGTIDLDARQGTLSRYLKNRWDYVVEKRKDIPSPVHMAIERSRAETVQQQQNEEHAFLTMALDELGKNVDFIVIDTPGTDSHLSALAHYYADTIVTPLNDSLVDLDVLAREKTKGSGEFQPSVYTSMVFTQMEKQKNDGRAPAHWIVMRNRLTHLNSQNKQRVGTLLSQIQDEFGFELVAGFGERVIFKELFLKGLTLLDLKEDEDGHSLSMSQLAARQEVRQLIHAINPQGVKGHVRPLD